MLSTEVLKRLNTLPTKELSKLNSLFDNSNNLLEE
jgi:hypothetical protein